MNHNHIISELIKKFDTLLSDRKAPILHELNDGLPISVIDQMLSQVVENYAELVLFYNWKNGISESLFERPAVEIELFPEGIMLSLQEAIERYILYTKTDKIWSVHYFPIFTNGGGDYYLYNLDKGSKDFGAIFLYAPSLLLKEVPDLLYDSIISFLRTIIECIEAGAYEYNPSGGINVDYDLKFEISKKHNSKSEYWKT